MELVTAVVVGAGVLALALGTVGVFVGHPVWPGALALSIACFLFAVAVNTWRCADLLQHAARERDEGDDISARYRTGIH